MNTPEPSLHRVRVSYRIKRVTNRYFNLYVTLTNRRVLAPYCGGGEMRLIAAFDSNRQLAVWIKKHPAPRDFVGPYHSCDKKADFLVGFYHTELAEKVFWGVPSGLTSHRVREFKYNQQAEKDARKTRFRVA